MNTEQYFKDEFQVYPETIRELIVFFAGSDCLTQLESPDQHIFADVLRGKLVKEDSKGLFTIPLANASLPSQKTRALAMWTYLNSKHVDVRTWQSPLIKQALYAHKRNQWNSPFDAERWIDWLAAINLQQGIWATHRQSDCYKALPLSSQHHVDMVGAAMKLVRKSVVKHLNDYGVDLKQADTQKRISAAASKISQRRLSKAKQHLEALPEDFRSKVFGYLRELG